MKEMFLSNPWAFIVCFIVGCITTLIALEIISNAIVDVIEANASDRKGE